jgi:hypothetical protein
MEHGNQRRCITKDYPHPADVGDLVDDMCSEWAKSVRSVPRVPQPTCRCLLVQYPDGIWRRPPRQESGK